MTYRYKAILENEYHRVYDAVDQVARTFGKIKEANQRDGSIKFKMGMRMDVNSILYDVVIKPRERGYVDIDIDLSPNTGTFVSPEKKADKYVREFFDKLEVKLGQKIKINKFATPHKANKKNYKSTHSVGDYLFLNDNEKTFFIPPQGFLDKLSQPNLDSWVFGYDKLISYELIEDGSVITKGGLGMAAIGAATFGLAGAIVGSSASAKKTSNICTLMQIKVTLNDKNFPAKFITFIRTDTPKRGFIYNETRKQAFQCIALFEIIDRENKTKQSTTVISRPADSRSNADEILKYYKLMEKGVISPDEFEKKKKELL